MVRPAASDINKAIALTFADTITKVTHDTTDVVARCGRCGLFSALKEVYPQTVRHLLSGVRDGVSEMEFNKKLQVARQPLVDLSVPISHEDLHSLQDICVSATAAQAP
jgi:hypothetical protein